MNKKATCLRCGQTMTTDQPHETMDDCLLAIWGSAAEQLFPGGVDLPWETEKSDVPALVTILAVLEEDMVEEMLEEAREAFDQRVAQVRFLHGLAHTYPLDKAIRMGLIKYGGK